MRNYFFRNTFDHKPATLAYAAALEISAPDERVRAALQAADYIPQETPGHNFSVTLRYPSEGRTQAVLIGSGTQADKGREWRRVWTWAYDVPGELPWEQALALLNLSGRPPLGSWFIQRADGKTSVGYQIMVPADASPAELDTAIQVVGQIADDKEKATVGTDEY